MPDFEQTMLDRLNSATKYPSILTYHMLDPKNGLLIENSAAEFPADQLVVLTEKVDGACGRIIVLPDGDFFLGSREELLYAANDRIQNPNLGIVPTLLPFAPDMRPQGAGGFLTVYFLEVYGHGIGGAARQYTTGIQRGARMFDIAFVPLDILNLERGRIAAWRDHGGQRFAHETMLRRAELALNVDLTPRLELLGKDDLPQDLKGMQEFLREHAPSTQAALDASAQGSAEGIVLRSEDRSVIVKAMFQDYARTLNPQPPRKKDKKEGKQWRKEDHAAESNES
jgi:hypothetical protein